MRWLLATLGLGGLALGGYAWAASATAYPKSGVPAMPGTKTDFVRRVLRALEAFPQVPYQGKLLIVAHAAYESGWGRSVGAAQGNNLFNIVAGKSWLAAGKPTVKGPDKEYRPDGTIVEIVQDWRVYASDADSIADYLKLISEPRFGPALAKLYVGDPTFVVDLGTARPAYYTLPVPKYLDGFKSRLFTVLSIAGTIDVLPG